MDHIAPAAIKFAFLAAFAIFMAWGMAFLRKHGAPPPPTEAG